MQHITLKTRLVIKAACRLHQPLQECLEAAGEWETLMAVCVCCGDFGALRSMAAGLKVRDRSALQLC
jgi:hypothetical protein